jgi:hypothetical protein
VDVQNIPVLSIQPLWLYGQRILFRYLRSMYCRAILLSQYRLIASVFLHGDHQVSLLPGSVPVNQRHKAPCSPLSSYCIAFPIANSISVSYFNWSVVNGDTIRNCTSSFFALRFARFFFLPEFFTKNRWQ